MIELKTRNPDFKPMLGLGGAGAGFYAFSEVNFLQLINQMNIFKR